MLTAIPITPEQRQAGLVLHLRQSGLPPDPEPRRCLVCKCRLMQSMTLRKDAKYCSGCQLDHAQPARQKANRARIKAALALLSVIITLCLPAKLGAQGNLGSNSSPVVNRQGIPLANVKIAVCQPAVISSATVTSNLAVLTMAGNPITAGFTANMTMQVAGFTGGDTYLNAGTLTNGVIVGGWTILSVSPTTITFAITHANASTSTTGTTLQVGNSVTSCAGLAAIYQDFGLSIPATNPTTSDQLGNWNVFASSGIYYVQFYSPSTTTVMKVIGVSFPSISGVPGLASNNTFTGTNSFSAPTVLSGGGAISGTYSGSPTFSGNPIFSGTPVLNNGLTLTGNLTSSGAGFSGTFSGSPTFSGQPAFSSGINFSGGQSIGSLSFNVGTTTVSGTGVSTAQLNVTGEVNQSETNGGAGGAPGFAVWGSDFNRHCATISENDIPAATPACVSAGQYFTPSAATTASIGATPMVTVDGAPANIYRLSAYLTQTVLGASCAGNSTIVVNAIHQDTSAASLQTQAIGTWTVTTNGTLGIIPLTTFPGMLVFLGKNGTLVEYSTTFSAGGACSPAPTYQVYPILEKLN